MTEDDQATFDAAMRIIQRIARRHGNVAIDVRVDGRMQFIVHEANGFVRDHFCADLTVEAAPSAALVALAKRQER